MMEEMEGMENQAEDFGEGGFEYIEAAGEGVQEQPIQDLDGDAGKERLAQSPQKQEETSGTTSNSDVNEAYEKMLRAQERYIVDTQIREINQIDSQIKSMDDFVAMKGYDDFYDLVQKGLSLTQAYKLVNFERLNTAAIAAAKQEAINSFRSKEHLKKSGARGASRVNVPGEIIRSYKLLMPEISAQEISEHYNKYMRGR